MVLDTCNNCKKVFNRKCNYKDHTDNKKKPCKAKIIIIDENPPNLAKNEILIFKNPPENAEKIEVIEKDHLD